MPKTLLALLGVVVLVGFSASAEAAALLRITSLNDEFPSSTTESPVFIGGDGFRLTYISSGDGENADKSLLNPVFLILGVPDGGTAPTLAVQDTSAGISSVTVARGGANFYGGTWDPITGLVAQPFDGTLPGNEEVYHDIVGFEYQGNGSQNYAGNWTTYDPSPTTSWDIYVYTLTFTPDFAKSNWVDFVGTLATATYVVGYGCDELKTTGPAPAGRCASNGDVYSTPFTYAGLVTGGRGGQQLVPEPASLLLFGTGLSVTAWASRRRRKKTS